MEDIKEEIRYTSKFYYKKGSKNLAQSATIGNILPISVILIGLYGITDHRTQLKSSVFNCGSYGASAARDAVMDLINDHKAFLSHLEKAGYKNNLISNFCDCIARHGLIPDTSGRINSRQ
ncbi:hypothetical protein V1477_000671 [Vespula maculifrons]|uniref:Uncharacterized protein n=1 Tax=Vespula maculifrons TaxID=7453 RepID=A0ABD2D2A0_VESMC